ncbi:possible transposase, C-terminal (plasmid) [Rhodococcus jostii RHA1]|uniref:Possible transposase, C-terminal n=1 Tax=Rhodococcus jostii (strain RHA1) TaxID=101510 RepID=Q0S064_RHOJR|nr:possible transposase, C-terminal [Rhodococcus jostii RHA1]
MTTDAGWVNVGVDHDTAAFAVASIRRWWQARGAADYPHATRLLITADAGGSNSYRYRLWKAELAALATETGLAITVCHFPPGTSNRVGNWRGDAVRAFRFQPPPPRFRACGSPAHGSPTSFTTGIRLPPPVPEGPGGDDVPRKADQAQMVRGGIRHHVPSEAAGALVTFADEQRHPHPHVLPDHPEAVC